MKLIETFIRRIGNINDDDKANIKRKCYGYSIYQLSDALDIRINDTLIKKRKSYFAAPDRRYIVLLKFI